jgi:hypothetical protein
MQRVQSDLLLVGSIPLTSAAEVFETSYRYLGPYLASLPDGETGPRTIWIGYLARDVYDGHPDISTVQKLDVNKPTSFNDTSNRWIFRLKDLKSVPCLETGYARFAVDSYAQLARLQMAGKVSKEVRFQVCFPSAASAYASYFDDPNDWLRMGAAYEDAFRRDIKQILETVSADDLAVQIDVCVEFRDIKGGLVGSPPRPNKLEETAQAVARLASHVPAEVVLGIHWCYGTLGGWPIVRIEDLDLCTRLSNATVSGVSRPVDYIHMPVLRQATDAYFAPLKDLDIGTARIYLGIIHHTDGMEGFRRRFNIAKRHLREFGVASVCGYGRLGADETRLAFELHREAGKFLRVALGP